jgi:hypothetical protein
MPVSADKHFEKRKPNFFKANSKVVMAQGFEVGSMKSVVGFTSTSAGYNHFAVLELEEQEHGGVIDHRSFVPMDAARTSESNVRAVRPGNRLSVINKIINAKDAKGSSRGQRFIKSAVFAGRGGFVLSEGAKKKLYKIESIDGSEIKARAIYSFEEGRSVNVDETGFMKEATLNTASHLEKFYIEEANRRFQKAFK